MVDETRVRYKAIADFTSLARSVGNAKRRLKELREEEARLNAESARGSNRAASANDRRAASMLRMARAMREQNKSIADSTTQLTKQAQASQDFARAQSDAASSSQRAANAMRQGVRFIAENSRAQRENARSQRDVAHASREAATGAKDLATGMSVVSERTNRLANGVTTVTRHLRRLRPEFRDSGREAGFLLGAVDRLNSGFRRLGNWRPHLTPPFIALIPIIAGVLGLINPLVAGLGAVGGAAIGFASSLGSVAGAALAAAPALAGLLSIVAALKMSFGGIGGAFKAFQQMKKATAAGGGGGSTSKRAELTQQEEITRAQQRYARSIQDTAWAQEDLDEARKDYIKRLRELQKAVDRAAMSEARAAANSQLARENYANVLADPGSTKGDKMLAKVGVDEAAQEYKDVLDQNKENAQDLANMKRKGMDGDREVIRAQRALTDAIWAQRDAQLALVNAQTGADRTQSAQTTAINAYNEALNKLSPSARRFVKIILGMSEAWAALKRRVQERFFSEFVDNVGRLRLLFGPLESMLGNAASALGRFVDNFLLLVTSPAWRSDMVLFGERNVPIIDNIGAGLLDVLDAFRDITIVAQEMLLMPMAETFKNWADEFRGWVAAGRESGGLADYLEGVRTRLAQWWRIVKNIGKTLFNYGKAAGDFGQWITNGFEKTTEGWLASSEEALGPNSKFRKWLEDIKPLLSEIKGAFADFFGWFARESADTDNIKQMIAILQTLRDDLGPALSRLFDKLSEAEIGPKFIDSVAKLVDIIASLVESPAVGVFFDVLNTLLDVAKWIVSNPILGGLLMSVASGFAALAAVSFVSKFSGLTGLINTLLKFAKSGKGLPGLLGAIASSMGFAVGAGATGAAAGAAGGRKAPPAGGYPAGTRRGPGGGSYKPPRVRGGGLLGLLATLGIGLAPTAAQAFTGASGGAAPTTRRERREAASNGGLTFLSQLGKRTKPGDAAKVSKGFNIFSSIGKGAKGGGGVGIIASILGTIAGDAIASSAPEGKAGAGARVGGGVLAGAASGAGLGALIGSIFPGAGTAIGAGAGALIGGGVAFATGSDEDRSAMFEQIGSWLNDISASFGKWLTVDMPAWLSGVWDGFMNWLTVDIPGWVQSLADGFMNWLTVDMPAWFQGVVDGFFQWLTVDLPYSLGYAAGLFMNWLTVDLPEWLNTVWTGFMTWLTVDMPAWLGTVWNGFMTWLTVDVPAWIGTAASRFWTWLTVDVPAWIGNAASTFWTWLTVDVPAWIGQAADKFWTWLTVDLPASVVDAGKAIGDGFTNFFKDFFSGTGKFFKGIGDAWNNFWGGVFGNVEAGYKDAKGDAPRRVGAGNTERRIRKLLPGGMRISSTYRSPEENRRVGGTSNSLHMDRRNPAVDIVGTLGQMNKFALMLAKIGGWRQLIYNNIKAPGISHYPGHRDHIHVANTGGKVPGRGNGDTVPSMLTPGEFVVRKAIVSRVGPENLARFNSGVMSYAELLQRSMANSNSGQKSKNTSGGIDGISFFGGGGLVPDLPGFGGTSPTPPGGPDFPGAPEGGSAPFIAGDIIINNPVPEPASDSLPRTIRKMAYLGGRK